MTGMTGAAPAPVRGCGTRVKGGAYLVCGLSYNGKPVEHFIVDAPIALSFKQRDEMGLTPVGVRLVDSHRPDGAPHVFDWVGSDSYPNVADFVEEVKRFGMSRRAPAAFDFKALRPGSRQVLVHSRACIERPEEYQRVGRMRMEEGYKHCPKAIEAHQEPAYEEMCADLWWEDVDGDGPGEFAPAYPRSVVRQMPAFSYQAWQRPYWAAPTYTPGVFMTLPITGIHVIRDDATGRHEAALARVRGASIPYELRDE